MKKLLVFILLLMPAVSFAQNDFPSPFEFTIIDSVDASKDELFARASEWMAKTFNSSKDVIQLSDKETGKIIGKAEMICPFGFGILQIDEEIKYTITIKVKDGRFKAVISDMYDDGCLAYPKRGKQGSLDQEHSNNRGVITHRQWYNLKDQAQSNSLAMLKSLKRSMRKGADNF